MRAHQRSLDAIAGNLANLGTNGYKRLRTAHHEFDVPRPGAPGKPAQGLGVVNQVDFSQGDLQRTGRPLDLALYGEGFFAVEGPRGEVYTREGSFHTTSEGVLVTQEGHPLAWDELRTTIDPTGLPVEVDDEGTVRQGADEVGRLRIVNFKNPARLRQSGDGYWSAPAKLPRAAHGAVVHQGALEDSNSAGVEELVAMVAVQRSFETAARVMSAIDDSYSRLTQSF